MKYLTLSNLRRLSQIVFLLLFVLLLLRTEFRGSLQGRGDEIRLPYPVQLFFQLDPLVADLERARQPCLVPGLDLEPPGPDPDPLSSAASFVAGSVPWAR